MNYALSISPASLIPPFRVAIRKPGARNGHWLSTPAEFAATLLQSWGCFDQDLATGWVLELFATKFVSFRHMPAE
jgi:hypothetical protein